MIKLDPRVKPDLLAKLHEHFEQELNQDLGQFEAEFLLDFLVKEFAPVFYNQGLQDAQAVMRGRLDTLLEEVELLEQRD